MLRESQRWPGREIKQWKECPFRHKLAYIDKIDTFKPSPYLHFGTAVHEGCETLIETGKVDRDKILGVMKESWQKAGFEDPAWYSKQPGWYKGVFGAGPRGVPLTFFQPSTDSIFFSVFPFPNHLLRSSVIRFFEERYSYKSDLTYSTASELSIPSLV